MDPDLPLEAAAAAVAGAIVPTPLTASTSLSELTGRTVLCKHEERQRTGSFKIRGATAFLAHHQIPAGAEVVAASAGNHAQGVALAATRRGLPATIYMPEGTPLPKVAATRHYGAEVRLVAGRIEDAIAAARDHHEQHGAVFVPPFDDPAVVAGQGTVGLELAEEAPDAEVVVVPVGGGGLAAGIGAALDLRSCPARVVGVEVEAAASMAASLAAGRPVSVDVGDTMADGIAVGRPSELTLALFERHVDEVVVVGEEDLSRALLLLAERTKSVVEPAGAAGLAALLSGAVGGSGPAVCVLSGGNVDPLLLTKLLDHGLTAAGRYLVAAVNLADHPGELAELVGAIGRLGVNIVDVEHHRSGMALAVGRVRVELTLETRDAGHHREVIAALAEDGFDVSRPGETQPSVGPEAGPS